MAIQNVRLAITGMPGTGKSTILRHLLEQVLAGRRRRYYTLVDQKDDHWPMLRRWGFKRVEIGPEQATLAINWKRIQAASPRLFIHVSGLRHEERLALADTLGWLHMGTPDSLLILEEVQYFYPNVGKRPEGLERLLNAGRAIGADVWLCSQRLQHVHPEGLSACNYAVVFRLREPNSAQKAAALLGGDRDTVVAIGALPNYHYIEADIENGSRREGTTPGPV
jgi:hypothetical protein